MWATLVLIGVLSLGGCRAANGSQSTAGVPNPWQGGTEHTYDVALDSEVSLSGQRVVQFRLDADWVVGVEAQDGASAILRTTFNEARLTSEMSQGARGLKALEGELSEIYWLYLGPDGRTAKMEFKPGTNSLVVGIVRTIFSSVQLARGAGATDGMWTAREFDNTGEYEARYTHQEDGSLLKEKTAYLRMLSAPGAATSAAARPKADVHSARATLRFEPGGSLASLSDSEEISVVTQRAPPTRLKMNLSAVLKGKRRADPASKQDGNVFRLAADEAYLPDDEKSLNAARAGDYSFDQAVRELTELGQAAGRNEEPEAQTKRAKAFSALRGILSSDDGAVKRAIEMVRQGSDVSDALLQALSLSGNPLAQHEMLRLLENQKEGRALTASLVSNLCLSENPTKEASQTLVSLMDDPRLGTQATYGVGMHVRQLYGRNETERADQLLRVLTTRLASRTTEIDTITTLRAIANSSYPRAISAVKPYFASDEARVRVAAVQALRNMDAPAVDPLLVAALADEEASVRRVAAKVAAKRPGTRHLVSTVDRLARSEPNDHARLAAIEALIGWMPSDQNITKTLKWVAENDAQPHHQMIARRALNHSVGTN